MSNDAGNAIAPAQAEVNAASTAPPPARGGRLLAVLALLGVGLGGAGAGYWVKRVYEPAQATIATALASNDRSTTGLGGELRGLHDQLRAMEEDQRAATRTTEGLAADLAALRAALAAPSVAAETRLRHARIEHLVKTAALVLQQQDVPRAIAALTAAAAELAPDDAAEDALRAALARDQSTLATLARADVAALAAQWAEIAHTVDAWPWPQDTAPATAPGNSPDSTTAGGWRALVAAIWRDVRQLVEIRPVDDADPRLADPSREALVKAALKLEMSLLRAGLTARDEVAVRATAATLDASIRAAFVRTEAPVAAALAALGELATAPLAPALPTLEESLRALDGLRPEAATPAATPPDPPAVPATAPMGDAPREFM